MAERDLDVVVFGATGVTGRRVVAYLAERCPETGASWAAAVRDPAKLERLLAEDGVSTPETIVADLDDPESLAGMASRAKVVLNLAGPYTRFGRPVIEACVAQGAHYADLTGEIPFVRRMTAEFGAAAEAAGVKLVQVCGFESLPPDLSVRLAAEAARERWDEDLTDVDLTCSVKGPPGRPHASDMISGGTFQSMAAVAAADGAEDLDDPAALVDDEVRAAEVRRRSPIAIAPRRHPNGAVIAPMLPAPFINPAVIQRTAALIAAEEGRPTEPFRYREGVALPGSAATLPLRFAAAGAAAGTQAALRGAVRARPSIRRRFAGVLESVLPSSGYGPAADRLEGWQWRVAVDAQAGAGHSVHVEVNAEGHPGYLATARMLGEAGLLLGEPGATPDRSGALTPATALGTDCVDRFERAKVHFSVDG